MTGVEYLVDELKKHSSICYYPSCGNDLSNIDFFASGMRPLEERRGNYDENFDEITVNKCPEPDLFIHTDINFYMEFEAGKDLELEEYGIHGSYEIIEFRELPTLQNAAIIFDNYDFTGKCFEYKLKLRNSPDLKTLIFCLCENEFFVSRILLQHQIKVSYIWCKNWNGSSTYGTWLANVLDRLQTTKLYTDWLCVPGQRGQPRNRMVEEKYPELMSPPKVKLVRNNDTHWIEEGAHGWVEEFDVVNLPY